MNLAIVLPLRNQAELTSLLGRLYDPTNPDYRHFLSVDQFTEQFGPTADDYQAVVSFAQANGLVVTGTPANRLIVPISGSVAQINSAFNLKMNSYQHPTEDRTFFSPDREPSLSLSVPVAHIAGLNNFSLPHPAVKISQQGLLPADVTGSGPGGSYLGSDMRAAYYSGTTLTGTGQAVGLLEFGGYDINDVNSTFTNAGQSYTVPVNNVLLDGATGDPAGDDSEQVLDIVQAIGMAPGLSQVRVYIGSSLIVDDANIFNAMATENIAKQISVSWGWYPDDPSTDDVFFQEFAAQGQSVFVASGDSGAFDTAISPFFYPSEDDYVTSVGGTHLTTNGAGGTWGSETVWNSGGGGSGGGISPDSIPLPSWQAGVATTANGGSTTLRNEPDVAMEGDFDNYYCASGACGEGAAGTSFAAPRWAGFMALVNQQAVEAGNAPLGGIGFINPAIYTIGAGANYGADFHDITNGNNLTDNQPVWFSAISGYDLTTGWGSADGQSLIDALAGPQVPGFWLAPSVSTLGVNLGASATATIKVTGAGGFSDGVTLAVTSTLPSGVTASWGTNPTTGSSVLTLTASSSAAPVSMPVTITGTSTGSYGTLTETTSLTLSVNGPSFTLAASPAGLSIGQGATATSTIAVTSLYGFTGSVNLAVTSVLPTGVTASWGTNPTSGTSVLTLTASSTAPGGTTYVTITGTSGSLTATTSLAVTVTAPTFTLFNSQPSLGIGQGSSGTSTIYVNSLNGFNGSVNLAVSTLPSGVTASWSTNPTSGTSILTLTATSSATIGQYSVTVTGTSGNLTATTPISLGVYAPTFTLSASGVNMGQGSSNTSYVNLSPLYGFTGSVSLAVSGLPTGVTASFSPNPTTGNSTLTLTASSSATIGQSTVTVTGTAGSQTKSATFSLGVFAPTFTLSASNMSVGQGSSSTSYVWVFPQYGFTGSANLAVSGLPTGVTASFSPNPTTGTSQLTLAASSLATIGSSTVTVTGTSGSLTATTTLSLSVYAPTFTLSASSVSLGQGSSNTSYVNVSPEYGFTGSVTLSLSGLPSGVTGAFLPNPTTGSSTLTLTASSSAPIAPSTTVTVTGTSGSLTKTTTFTLGVYAPTFTLSAPSVSLGQGSSSTSYVYMNQQYGFTGSVSLSASGLPTGVTASFSPNPTTGSSTLTLTASSSVTVGQYTVTINGTGTGSVTAYTTFPLTIVAPSFTLFAPNLTLGQGSSGTSYVYVYPQNGFTGNVNLSASGLPSGVTASFTPNPTTGSSTLTLTASSSVPVGQYTATINGTSGSVTASTPFAFGVYAQGFTLWAGSVNLGQGHSATSAVSVYPQYGFTGNVTLSASGLPSGVTAAFAPNPTTGTSTMTLTASSSAAVGQYTVTVTGTSGSLTASTTASLGVYVPSFTLWTGGASIAPGGTGTSSIEVTPQYGFSGNVTLTASGLPSGVTAAFTPNPTTANSTLTLAASSSTTPGQYNVTITGTSGTQTVSTTLALGISAASFTLATYSSPSIGQGSSGQSYIYINPQNGFTGSVTLSASGLPSGVTAAFTPNPATGASTVTFAASSSATLGQYNVTITGTSGTQTATTTMVLGVYAQDFTLYASSLNIGQGTTSTTSVSVNPLYGFTGNVTLSVSGLPSGVTGSFAQNPTTGTSQLSLTATSSAALGQYNVTVTGTSGSLTRTTLFTLGVYVPGFTLATYSSPSIGQGSSASSYVYLNPQYGFTGAVTLSVSGLPSGVTASFAQNPMTGSTLLTLSATSSAPIGQYNATITGTSGTQTASTTLPFGIYAQGFTLWAPSVSIGQGSSTSSYVYIYPQYGFNGAVALSVSGLPSGVTASWGTNPTTGGGQLTLTASSSATLGQYTATITGTSGSLTAITTISVGVYAQSFSLYSWYNSQSINPGGSITSGITLTPQYGFNGSVNLTASGLPSGVTASFSPAAISSGYSTLTLTAGSTAVPGTATVTITGTSGSLTASTTLGLTVKAEGFTLSGAPGQLNLNAGGSGMSTITVIPLNGFSGNVGLTATGLPSGVTAFWRSNPTASTSQLTLSASSTATTGSATVTITGTSGTIVANMPLPVTVSPAPVPTSTTLAVTSGGAAVSTVASPSIVTLTAVVSAGSTAVTTGQVNFCNAAWTYCGDSHLLGSAQLTSAGTATLKIVPGMGSHSYNAVFLGTNASDWSSSSASVLKVTASNASTTTIAQSGIAGNYALTATVKAQGLLSPSGSVAFLDTTNHNSSLGTATLALNGTTLSWLNSQSAAVGAYPSAVAVGDFNGDGIPDLAVTNQASNTATIFLGNGDGTFTATASPVTSYTPASVAVGDFNGDGNADLAVVNLESDSVTILVGDGKGAFTAEPASPATGSSPNSVAVGDFNGDGIQDLAVTNLDSNSVTILLGNGDGTFSPAASPATGSEPESVAVGDFNRDGIEDLAVVNGASNTVTILLGNGDGTFVPAASPSTGYSPLSVAIGDFNRDGVQDLAVANSGSGTVTILLGNGDGTFTPGATQTVGGNPSSVRSGDFNGDGQVDLAVTNSASNTVTVLLGKGDGTFTASTVSLPANSYPWATGVGDFNKDGLADLVVVNQETNTMSVLTSQLTQTATATATGISPAGQGQHLVDASYAGDGNYTSSLSGTTVLTAVAAIGLTAPTMTVTPSAATITDLQAVNVTVAVAGGSGQATPTGNVTLSSGSYSAQQTLSSGVASFVIAAGTLPIGVVTLKATYTPDTSSSNIYSTANQFANVTVMAVGTTTPTMTVTPSAAAVTNLQSVSITVALTGGSSQATPTGTGTLSSGSYSAEQTLSSGSSSFTIAAGTLPAGANTLSASYSGDGSFAAATGTTSVTVSQVVITAPAPSAVAPGSSATGTVSFSAGSTYSGTMNLTCSLTGFPAGAQSLPTCTVSPATVTLTPGASATTSVKVNTTAASTATLVWPTRLKFWAAGGGGSILAFVLMVGVPSRRRRWLSMLMLLWVIAAAGAIGCGGGGEAQSPSSPNSPATPATTVGSYTFTVTGTDTANATITTSASVVINVQ
jgi:hypothetical protein